MKRYFVVPFFFACGVLLYGEVFPDWFIVLRDAVYEQNLGADEIAPLYRATEKTARETLSGKALYLMLSRCEYMMGRAYQYEERKDEAAARYEAGMAWAEKSLEEGASSEGWRMLAENISQSCAVKSVSYAMANGLKVEKYAKNALDLDPRNSAALYMIAARYVFAPSPFHNYRRGIRMMEDIIDQNETIMEKDDRFNVYSAIGYAYMQQKNYREAKPWLEKSLIIYPTNKFVRIMFDSAG
ncbi:MAG: tetratricopeptide repeat protein [Spirochaetaceae bacterium]|jgi:tetratricopeptide (TPR) repeat protein|nr:tetratricopeptide repeat protein [Spirochaetaceae bacterium]